MSFYSGSLLFTATVSAALGIFVFLQGRRKLANIFLALFSAALSGWCFGQLVGEAAGSKEVVLFWTRFNTAAAIFIPVFFLHFILAFVKQEKENRIMLSFAYLAAVVLLILDFTPWFVADVAPRFGRFYPVPGIVYPVPGIVYPVFPIYLLLIVAIGFLRLIAFMKESKGEVNNQAKYVFIASVVGFAGGITAFFPVFNLDLPVISHFFLPLYLAIAVYAIVKHKLLDINVIIREGLVYTTLTVFFAGFYALMIFLTGRFFQNLTRFDEIVTSIIVVFASVLVFQPLRDRVQRGVDRLFFRGEFFYQKTINYLSAENLKLYRSLLQADKLAALGTIAAGMAHEIKNPLASIKGLTQVLPENLEDSGFIQKYSEIVPRQIERINRIVEDLLDFGHPKELAIGEVKIEEILGEVLRLVENQCRKSNIEIIREFYPVPLISADSERLSQAFMNVILNAVQAMPGGGKLLIGCKPLSNDEIEVEISDSGKGIPEDKLPNIFDPFFTTKGTGTGMGLAVTYRIVKEHGGKIEVESEPGAGTTFKIWLPIKPKRSA